MNQLRQIFDRINIVVRRRADQADARHAVAQLADVVAYLAAGQLATLAWLGTLRHFDLNLVGRYKVFRRHPKAARGYLLDLAAQRVACLQRDVRYDAAFAQRCADAVTCFDDRYEALAFAFEQAKLGVFTFRGFHLRTVAQWVFTALTRVALTANAVHRHSQRAVCFGAD